MIGQIKFAIPYFDVYDPRLTDFGVPVAVHGEIIYSVNDIEHFKTVNQADVLNEESFKNKLKGQVVKYVKSIVSNIPTESQIPVGQLERKIDDISELAKSRIAPQVERIFGIIVESLDITDILIDKTSIGYQELKALTAELERENVLAKHSANLSSFNLQNELQQNLLRQQSALSLDSMKRQQELNLSNQEQLQAMQLENQRETLRIQREEMQRASRLQTEQTFLGAHQANLNASGILGMTNGTNMQQMPGMPQLGMNVPQVQYMVGINGQPAGPFDWNQLKQLVRNGQLTQQSLVWKQDMTAWAMAGQIMELQPLFVF